MNLAHMVDAERREIGDLTRALFATDAAGLATIHDDSVSFGVLSLHPDHATTRLADRELSASVIERALDADPNVVFLTQGELPPASPFTSFVGVVVPNPLGEIEGVLWAGSLDADRPIASGQPELLEVLARQLSRRLDTAEEQRQLRDASLSVSESAGALATNLIRVEASNRDLEAFAYVASHELARPLSAIRSLSEVMRDAFGGEEPVDRDVTRRALGQIEENARQLQQQIAALLAMSRLDAGAEDLVSLQIADIVQDVRDQLAPLITSTGAEITVCELPTVMAEAASMTAIIRNFVSNALVYRSPDRSPHISISAKTHDQFFVVSVTDNGLGIEPEDIDRLFQMFQRGRSGQPGTGIGLALCARLVSRMGGEVGAEPNESVGSRFWFSLPR